MYFFSEVGGADFRFLQERLKASHDLKSNGHYTETLL